MKIFDVCDNKKWSKPENQPKINLPIYKTNPNLSSIEQQKVLICQIMNTPEFHEQQTRDQQLKWIDGQVKDIEQQINNDFEIANNIREKMGQQPWLVKSEIEFVLMKNDHSDRKLGHVDQYSCKD